VLVHLKRLFGFSLIPAFSLLASIVLLPLVSGQHGAHGVVALAVGQSVGAILSVMASLAWPVVGGHAVAVADDAERRRLFVMSVYSRLVVLLVLLPFGIAVCLVLVSDYRLATCFFMTGIACNGMTMGWFYSGLGEPRKLVLHEGVVRLVGYAVAALALTRGAPLVTYAAITTLAALTSLGLNWLHVIGWKTGHVRQLFGQAWTTIVEHRAGTMSRVLQAGFFYGGPTIFASLTPGSVSVYAAMDQMQKATANAAGVFPQSLVSFVSGESEHRWRRGHLAFAGTSAAGLVVVVAWAAVGPEIVNFLFSGEVDITRWGATLIGLSVAVAMMAKTYESLVLVPMGLAKSVFRADSAFAVLGIAVLALASTTGSANLTMASWTLVNLALLVFVAWVARRHGRRTHDDGEQAIATRGLR